jgi:hypothetical protein
MAPWPRRQAAYGESDLLLAELSGSQVQFKVAEGRDEGAERPDPEAAGPSRVPANEHAAIWIEGPEKRAARDRPRWHIGDHGRHLILGGRRVQGVQPGAVLRERQAARRDGIGQYPGRCIPVII